MNGSKEPVIRASEVGEYVFCPKAWWLRRVKGLKPESLERLEEGRKFHNRHQERFFALRLLWYIGIALLLAGLCLIAWEFIR